MHVITGEMNNFFTIEEIQKEEKLEYPISLKN